MRSGVKSTEFYLTVAKGLIGPIMAILVGTGVLDPSSESEMVNAVTQVVTGIITGVALFTSGSAIKSYTENRTAAKVNEEQLKAHDRAAQEPQSDLIGFGMSPEDEEYEDDEPSSITLKG